MHVEPTANGDLRVGAPHYEPRSGRFDVTFELPAALAPAARCDLTGSLTATVETWRLTRVGRARRGHQAMPTWRSSAGREPRSHGEVVSRSSRRSGLAARSACGRQAAAPRRPDEAELVRRDEAVTIVYEVPGIMLTVRGKATEGGAEGDVINVLNVQSKRPVQGEVSGPGRVTIPAPPRHRRQHHAARQPATDERMIDRRRADQANSSPCQTKPRQSAQ